MKHLSIDNFKGKEYFLRWSKFQALCGVKDPMEKSPQWRRLEDLKKIGGLEIQWESFSVIALFQHEQKFLCEGLFKNIFRRLRFTNVNLVYNRCSFRILKAILF